MSQDAIDALRSEKILNESTNSSPKPIRAYLARQSSDFFEQFRAQLDKAKQGWNKRMESINNLVKVLREGNILGAFSGTQSASSRESPNEKVFKSVLKLYTEPSVKSIRNLRQVFERY